MTVYFLVDSNNLVANVAEYPEGMVPDEVSSNWLSTEENIYSGKLYNKDSKTFSDKPDSLKNTEPVSQLT